MVARKRGKATEKGGRARPGHTLDPYSAPSIQKTLVFDVLERSVTPMSRQQVWAALNWAEKKFHPTLDPLHLLVLEGKVGKTGRGSGTKYYAHPNLAEQLIRGAPE